MDATNFDQIAKILATRRLSRRQAMASGARLAGLATTAISAARLGSTQGATAQGTPPTGSIAANNATLFVQTASSGTFQPNSLAGSASPAAAGTATAVPRHGAYRLTLEGHPGETIYFADRPQRIFGEVQTPRFFKSMGFTPVDPPNAALVADTPAKEDDIVLVELLNPTYDAGTRTLTYEANLLHQYPNARGSALASLAAKAQTTPPVATFGSASLFIDDCPDITTCYTLGVYPAGPVPGGPIGTCWNSWTLICEPCNGDSIQFLEQMCNQTYPDKCGGSCVVYTA